MMSSPPPPFVPPRRSWLGKFRDAARGIVSGMRDENSFLVHIPAAIAVLVAAVVLRANAIQWSLLILCIAQVIAAELFNSALERLSRAIDGGYNEQLRVGLNIASGAVLILSLGSAAVANFSLSGDPSTPDDKYLLIPSVAAIEPVGGPAPPTETWS